MRNLEVALYEKGISVPSESPLHVATILTALGHPARLDLVRRLAKAETFGGQSISELAEGTGLTRQATTKHLEALAKAGLLIRRKPGRATWYELKIEPLHAVMHALESIADQRAQRQREMKAYKEKILGKDS